MRLVHAAALTAAAMLLASVGSAQGLGDAAAREKEKRKTGAKPAKVFTDSDLPPSSAPAAAQPAAAEASTGADGKPPDGQAADGKTKPKTEAELAAEAEKERQKAVDDWRAKLDEARKQEQQYRELIDRIQADLNDTSSLYTAEPTRKMQSQEEAKQKLAEVQARIADLEEQGRRSGYR